MSTPAEATYTPETRQRVFEIVDAEHKWFRFFRDEVSPFANTYPGNKTLKFAKDKTTPLFHTGIGASTEIINRFFDNVARTSWKGKLSRVLQQIRELAFLAEFDKLSGLQAMEGASHLRCRDHLDLNIGVLVEEYRIIPNANFNAMIFFGTIFYFLQLLVVQGVRNNPPTRRSAVNQPLQIFFNELQKFYNEGMTNNDKSVRRFFSFEKQFNATELLLSDNQLFNEEENETDESKQQQQPLMLPDLTLMDTTLTTIGELIRPTQEMSLTTTTPNQRNSAKLTDEDKKIFANFYEYLWRFIHGDNANDDDVKQIIQFKNDPRLQIYTPAVEAMEKRVADIRNHLVPNKVYDVVNSDAGPLMISPGLRQRLDAHRSALRSGSDDVSSLIAKSNASIQQTQTNSNQALLSTTPEYPGSRDGPSNAKLALRAGGAFISGTLNAIKSGAGFVVHAVTDLAHSQKENTAKPLSPAADDSGDYIPFLEKHESFKSFRAWIITNHIESITYGNVAHVNYKYRFDPATHARMKLYDYGQLSYDASDNHSSDHEIVLRALSSFYLNVVNDERNSRKQGDILSTEAILPTTAFDELLRVLSSKKYKNHTTQTTCGLAFVLALAWDRCFADFDDAKRQGTRFDLAGINSNVDRLAVLAFIKTPTKGFVQGLVDFFRHVVDLWVEDHFNEVETLRRLLFETPLFYAMISSHLRATGKLPSWKTEKGRTATPKVIRAASTIQPKTLQLWEEPTPLLTILPLCICLSVATIHVTYNDIGNMEPSQKGLQDINYLDPAVNDISKALENVVSGLGATTVERIEMNSITVPPKIAREVMAYKKSMEKAGARIYDIMLAMMGPFAAAAYRWVISAYATTLQIRFASKIPCQPNFKLQKMATASSTASVALSQTLLMNFNVHGTLSVASDFVVGRDNKDIWFSYLNDCIRCGYIPWRIKTTWDEIIQLWKHRNDLTTASDDITNETTVAATAFQKRPAIHAPLTVGLSELFIKQYVHWMVYDFVKRVITDNSYSDDTDGNGSSTLRNAAISAITDMRRIVFQNIKKASIQLAFQTAAGIYCSFNPSSDSYTTKFASEDAVYRTALIQMLHVMPSGETKQLRSSHIQQCFAAFINDISPIPQPVADEQLSNMKTAYSHVDLIETLRKYIENIISAASRRQSFLRQKIEAYTTQMLETEKVVQDLKRQLAEAGDAYTKTASVTSDIQKEIDKLKTQKASLADRLETTAHELIEEKRLRIEDAAEAAKTIRSNLDEYNEIMKSAGVKWVTEVYDPLMAQLSATEAAAYAAMSDAEKLQADKERLAKQIAKSMDAMKDQAQNFNETCAAGEAANLLLDQKLKEANEKLTKSNEELSILRQKKTEVEAELKQQLQQSNQIIKELEVRVEELRQQLNAIKPDDGSAQHQPSDDDDNKTLTTLPAPQETSTETQELLDAALAELNGVREELQNAKEASDSLLAENGELTNAKAVKENEIVSINERIEQLSQSILNNQKTIATQRTELDALQAGNNGGGDAKLEKLRLERDDLQRKLTEANRKAAEEEKSKAVVVRGPVTKGVIPRVPQGYNSWNDVYEALQASSKKLEENNKSLTSVNASLKTQISGLTASLKDTERARDDANRRIRECTAQKMEGETSLAKLRSKILTLERDLKQAQRNQETGARKVVPSITKAATRIERYQKEVSQALDDTHEINIALHSTYGDERLAPLRSTLSRHSHEDSLRFVRRPAGRRRTLSRRIPVFFVAAAKTP